jgi:hypothetical protein
MGPRFALHFVLLLISLAASLCRSSFFHLPTKWRTPPDLSAKLIDRWPWAMGLLPTHCTNISPLPAAIYGPLGVQLCIEERFAAKGLLAKLQTKKPEAMQICG